LRERGYTVDFIVASDPNGSKKFREYGIFNYDELVLFASTADDFAGISVSEVLEFIDEGNSVIVAADSNLGDATRDLASECNIEFDQSGTVVIDHLHFDLDLDDGTHSFLAVDRFVQSPVMIGKNTTEPILFHGIGQDIEEDSALLVPVLYGFSSTYSSSESESVKDLHVAGRKTSLVTALQARNNARVIFSGSLDLFSDRFFVAHVHRQDGKKLQSGNEQFTTNLVAWAFHERGLVRYTNVQHHRVGETIAPAIYTIKDHVVFSTQLEEWNGRRWTPYLTDDVQFEFIMLDPHVRRIMRHNDKGVYTVEFQLPDRYGVFTFRVDYQRLGYSFFTAISRSPVRPFRHNEYERFIDAASPYYASSFSLMIGLFLFSWVFLYHRDSKRTN